MNSQTSNLKVVVLGKGGREHALAWRCQQDGCDVTVIPGNPGMERSGIATLKKADPSDVVYWCQKNQVDLAIIGPEQTILDGLGDELRRNGIRVWAPSAQAAILEGSKAVAKNLMQEFQIPTAKFSVFDDANAAYDFINLWPWKHGLVVKLDGLAAGKGVVVCQTKDEAKAAVEDMLVQNKFKHHQPKLVMEECLVGPEVSVFALCNEDDYFWLGSACDYKRLGTGNTGPNTGGMGCYAPSFLNESEQKEIERTVIRPTLKAMKTQGTPFQGTLFVGLMMTEDGPKVLEYNVRFGDPETQTLLPLIEGNFAQGLIDILEGKTAELKVASKHSVHVVKAAANYPGTPKKDDFIELNEKAFEDVGAQIFFAGVDGDTSLRTSGGRVLGITAIGETKESARELAYDKIGEVRFSGEQFRTDIADGQDRPVCFR